MATLAETLRKTTSLQRKSSTSGSLQRLSQRQRTETEQFLEVFPTIGKVYAYFCPARWEHALSHVEECLTHPCVTLAQVDELYHVTGAAKAIVKGQLTGIYSLSTAREQYNEQAADLATAMFIAKYGHVCSLYDMMLYFGNYLLEYKSSYAAFDVQDVLMQFSRKYLPWRRQRVRPEEDQQQQTKGITLEEMVYKWVADGRTDESFHEGGLFQTGIITDGMIQAARSEFAKAADGAAF